MKKKRKGKPCNAKPLTGRDHPLYYKAWDAWADNVRSYIREEIGLPIPEPTINQRAKMLADMIANNGQRVMVEHEGQMWSVPERLIGHAGHKLVLTNIPQPQ